MPLIEVAPAMHVNVEINDYLWPWQKAVPVFMLHGFSRNLTEWTRWVPFAAEEHRVYRMDQRGCGKSDVPGEPFTVTVEQLSRDILTVMDRLGLEKIHYVGESSSGVFGTAFAAAHPDRVESLILVETSMQIRWASNVEPEFRGETRSDALRKEGVGGWSRRTLSHRVDMNKSSQEQKDWFVSEMDKTPVHVAVAMFECFSDINLQPLLKDIKAPTLLIRGALAGEKADQSTATMLKEIPRSESFVVPDTTWGLYVVEPEKCATAAQAFWKRVEAGS